MSTPQTTVSPNDLSNTVLSEIAQSLAGLKYGQVTIIVQDGRVMQIDRTDRRRLPQEPISASSSS
jgi:hypothetical protein